jgi:hypothetical protein
MHLILSPSTSAELVLREAQRNRTEQAPLPARIPKALSEARKRQAERENLSSEVRVCELRKRLRYVQDDTAFLMIHTRSSVLF